MFLMFTHVIFKDVCYCSYNCHLVGQLPTFTYQISNESGAPVAPMLAIIICDSDKMSQNYVLFACTLKLMSNDIW